MFFAINLAHEAENSGERFTDDGDIVLEDDADIPESARIVTSGLKTPFLEKKSRGWVPMRTLIQR